MRNTHSKLAASFIAVLTALVVSGCGNYENPDADTASNGTDAIGQDSSDVGTDVQIDSGNDVGTDAGQQDLGDQDTAPDVQPDVQAQQDTNVAAVEIAQSVTKAECAVDSDCNDNNPCTGDLCVVGGVCKHMAIAAACDDNNACTDNDVCANSTCKGTTKVCEDNNLCTDDFCINGNCVHGVNTTLCDDSNACTVNDKCSGGTCQGGAAKVCEDNNLCTADACDPKMGCVMTPVLCEDGDPCTTDSCDTKSGACSFVQKVCDDGKPYTNDFCDAEGWYGNPGQCVFNEKWNSCAKDSDCDDGNQCTINVCDGVNGTCKKVYENCNDNNPCTTDSCVPAKGCVNDATTFCNDNNVNTADTCDSNTGACIYTPISTPPVVPPTSGTTVKVEISCGAVACEVHPFFGSDAGGKSFDNLGPAPANGWYSTDLPKSQLCVWGMEVGARLSSMPSLPWFGCDVGAPSLNTVTLKVNGVVQPGVLTTHPWVCQGGGEGNKKYSAAAFGCQ